MKKTLAVAARLAILSVSVSFPLGAAGIAVGGRVLGPDAKPAPQARVSLIPVLSSAESGRLELAGRLDPDPVATASVDAAGAFHLQAPGAGMWKVRVEAPGFVPLETSLLPLLDETDLPDARLSPDVRLQARLTGAQGKPAAGARVSAEDPRPARPGESWRLPARLAVTDASGSATLPRAPQEVLVVRAAAADSLPAEQKGVRGGSASLRLTRGEARRIQVRDPQGKGVAGVVVRRGDSEWPAGRTSEAGLLDLTAPAGGADLRLTAPDGRRLSYRLRPAKPAERAQATPVNPVVIVLPAPVPVAGRIVSALDGRPLPGALAWPDGDSGAVVRAGADGAFRLPAVVEPEGSFEAAAAGFFPEREKAAAGRRPTLPLQPRLAASGIVVDEGGRPVAGAGLQVIYMPGPRSPELGNLGGHDILSFARSGESGRFRLSGLLPGSAYRLRIDAGGLAPAYLDLPAREAGRPAPELRIVLHPGRTVFGRVIDGGRRPVAGAQVSLRPAASSTSLLAMLEAMLLADPAAAPAPATDTAGRFEIGNLPAGSFDLTVRARGFSQLTVPGLAVPEGKGATDLGTVALAPGASLRGMVTDERKNPVEGAEVRARTADLEGFPAFLLSGSGPVDAVTAADGSFVLEDRTPGESLNLFVAHPGYGPGSTPGVAVPSENPVRIVLQTAARVSGRAVDPDGKPVAGATILLTEQIPVSFGGFSRLSSSGGSRQEVTDDEGGFSFESVSPGPIELLAQAPHRQPAELRGLEVKPGRDLAGVDVVLPPGGAIEGRVLAEGRPVPNARVVAMEMSAERHAGFPFMAATDGDGRYRLDGVPPGTHTLEANAEGYRRATRNVEVTAETRGVDFELDRGLEVAGRVIDGAGHPIPGIAVILISARGLGGFLSTFTGADGAFRLAGVTDGTYRLEAHGDGYVSDGPTQSVTVAGAPVSGLEVKLSTGARITGRLSGLELSQLSRVRIGTDSGSPGRVDAEGSYEILHVPSGASTVTASVPDTPLYAEGQVTLEPGATEARLDLQFGVGHTLTGVVLRNGEPLAEASLLLIDFNTTTMRQGSTDHLGMFRFGGLANGSYDLQASSPNGTQHHESVEISGDRELRIELHTASLSGRVINSTDASPIAGAQISLASLKGVDFTGATTDSRGVFQVSEVEAGAWKVRATRTGFAPGEREVRVEEGSLPDEVEIRMDPTEGVTVEALLASGRSPDHLRVAVLDASGSRVAGGSYPTGENGRTRLPDVPPGSWQLLVASDLSAPVTLAASSPGPVVHAILPPAGEVRVQVPALADGGGRVVLLGSGGPFRNVDESGNPRSEWPLLAGTATISQVPPGVWRLVARTRDGRSWSGTATVAPGGVAEVVLK